MPNLNFAEALLILQHNLIETNFLKRLYSNFVRMPRANIRIIYRSNNKSRFTPLEIFAFYSTFFGALGFLTGSTRDEFISFSLYRNIR